jgi:hypothetical protein
LWLSAKLARAGMRSSRRNANVNAPGDVGRINVERTDLTAADHDRFFGALDQPSAPTAVLRAAFRRHKEVVIRPDMDRPDDG